MIFIWLFILMGVLAYRELEILISRKSYKADYTWIKFWKTDDKSIWKNFDSFHFMWGLFALLMLEMMVLKWIGFAMIDRNYHFWILVIYEPLYFMWDWIGSYFWIAQVEVVIYWGFLMYFRNIWMHIIYANKKIWWYFIPFYEYIKMFYGYIKKAIK